MSICNVHFFWLTMHTRISKWWPSTLILPLCIYQTHYESYVWWLRRCTLLYTIYFLWPRAYWGVWTHLQKNTVYNKHRVCIMYNKPYQQHKSLPNTHKNKKHKFMSAHIKSWTNQSCQLVTTDLFCCELLSPLGLAFGGCLTLAS